MSRQVLHVTQRLAQGGAGTALRNLAQATQDRSTEQQVLSLVPPDEPARTLAERQGLSLVDGTSADEVAAAVRRAAVIHVHFWNTPELYEFLYGCRSSATTVVWSHVNGLTPPHVVTKDLLTWPDTFVATTPRTRLAPAAVDERVEVIRPGSDLGRFPARRAAPGRPFTIGVFGTLNRARVHPATMQVIAAANLPDARIRVIGAGDALPDLAAQARHWGLAERTTFTGHVADVPAALSQVDVALHLLRPDTSAASDLALSELLAAEVAVVLLADGPGADMVDDGRTGLLGTDLASCSSALRLLAEDPARRHRLAAQGRVDALRRYDTSVTAAAFREVWERPGRRTGIPLPDPARTPSGLPAGTARFLATLGPFAGPFWRSISHPDPEQRAQADDAIAASSPSLVGAGAGGILHYRGYYPDEPYLRYWAGLVFAAASRYALAAGDLHTALAGGVPEEQAGPRLAALTRAPARSVGRS